MQHRKPMNGILTLLLTLCSPWLWAEVQAEDGYVRATPPGQSNTAAFMVLQNKAPETVALIRAESTVADHVELHAHQHENGVMRMRQVAQIELPASGRVGLQPGGYHIMLIGLHQPMKMGQNIEMTLYFSDGSSTTLQLPVTGILPSQNHGYQN